MMGIVKSLAGLTQRVLLILLVAHIIRHKICLAQDEGGGDAAAAPAAGGGAAGATAGAKAPAQHLSIIHTFDDKWIVGNFPETIDANSPGAKALLAVQNPASAYLNGIQRVGPSIGNPQTITNLSPEMYTQPAYPMPSRMMLPQQMAPPMMMMNAYGKRNARKHIQTVTAADEMTQSNNKRQHATTAAWKRNPPYFQPYFTNSGDSRAAAAKRSTTNMFRKRKPTAKRQVSQPSLLQRVKRLIANTRGALIETHSDGSVDIHLPQQRKK